MVPDQGNITPQSVIICRFFSWRRHGIKCFARAVGIAEPNGTMCPSTEITLSVLAQFSYSSPKLDRSAQTCTLGRTRDHTRCVGVFRTYFNTCWASRLACL